MIAPFLQADPDVSPERREKVLVVGHHLSTLTLIEQALQLEGYHVTVALASEAWIEQAIAPGANLFAIVLDVGYPTDATVTGLLCHLRSCWEAANDQMPPLVVLTTNQHVPDLTPCPVLLKPFHLRDLYQALEQVRGCNRHAYS